MHPTTTRRNGTAEANRLRERIAALERENAELRRTVARVKRLELELAELRTKNAELERRNTELEKLLEEARRAGKRQAAPFSKGAPKENPKRPGRKPGKAYGKVGRREVPKAVDETLQAPLPRTCPTPGCGGKIVPGPVERQYVVDAPPPPPRTTCFEVATGSCERCGRRVQGRHPQQHSDALGAANVLIGPRALALATHMNKELGVSYVKLERLFETSYGLELQRSTLTRALLRIATLLGPFYEGVIRVVRDAPVIAPDETSWRVNGVRFWLWTFVTARATLYVIRQSRGHDVLFEILGEDFDGWLCRDGWGPYEKLVRARTQQCNNHLLNRADESMEIGGPDLHPFPAELKSVIKDALALRDQRDAGEVSQRKLLLNTRVLEERLETSLSLPVKNETSRRLQNFVGEHIKEILPFLREPALDATNFRAEQAIRGAVVNRKISGGNRTKAGASAQEILTTYFRTVRQIGEEPVALLTELLRAADPRPLINRLLRRLRTR